MFFISGITGNVGGAAARKLLAAGHAVRTLARDPQKAAEWSQKGVEVRQGDFNDPAALAAALQGVEGAYLMLAPMFVPSPGYPEAKATIASFQQALHQVPPPRLVLLSSIGSEQSSGLGNITTTHLMEEALDGLPFPPPSFERAASSRTTSAACRLQRPPVCTTASISRPAAPCRWSPPKTSATRSRVCWQPVGAVKILSS